jgi:tetratricopeptide (TPR) repeat protein
MLEEASKLIEFKEAPGNLDRAIELLERLVVEQPDKDIIRGKLSHAFFYKGFFAPEGSKQRAAFFERGMDYGKQAITLNRRAVYGNFWYASNLGMFGLCRGIMASLRSIDPMRRAMEVVLQENERFFFAGPHRALGRLYHQAPGWPVSIGSKTKAVDHLERGVELSPAFFCNRIYLAEFLLDIGKKAEARRHLEFVVSTPVNPAHQREDGDYQRLAQRLLDKIL